MGGSLADLKGEETGWWGRTRVGASDWVRDPWLGGRRLYRWRRNCTCRLRSGWITPDALGATEFVQGSSDNSTREFSLVSGSPDLRYDGVV